MPSRPIAVMTSATITSIRVKPRARGRIVKCGWGAFMSKLLRWLRSVVICPTKFRDRQRVQAPMLVESCSVISVPARDSAGIAFAIEANEGQSVGSGKRIASRKGFLKPQNRSRAGRDAGVGGIREHDPAEFPDVFARAGRTVVGHADRDVFTVLERFRARELQVAEQPIDFGSDAIGIRHVAERRYGERHDDRADRNGHEQLDHREARFPREPGARL